MPFIKEENNSKKNIVFIMNEYNGHGDTQKVTSILANSFVKDGNHVSVLSINTCDDNFSYFDNDVSITVLHKNNYHFGEKKQIIHSLKSKNYKHAFKELMRRKNFKMHSKRVDEFFAKFKDEKVFVIVMQVQGMQWLTNLYYKKNVKIIGLSHESYVEAKNTDSFNEILTYYRMVNKFLVLSKKDVELFEKEGFRNVDFILHPTSFTSDNDAETLYNNKKIVSVGQLIPEKGFQYLIKAFYKIHETYPEWKLSIYGNGSYYNELDDLIKSLHLTDKVILEGESNDIKTDLAHSSFFVLPSYKEGLPMDLIEAQSCGLPCVSTECAPVIREIINEYEDGLICNQGDIERLSMHLDTLLSQKNIFINYSQHASKNRKRFSVNEIKNKWYSLFETLEDE